MCDGVMTEVQPTSIHGILFSISVFFSSSQQDSELTHVKAVNKKYTHHTKEIATGYLLLKHASPIKFTNILVFYLLVTTN